MQNSPKALTHQIFRKFRKELYFQILSLLLLLATVQSAQCLSLFLTVDSALIPRTSKNQHLKKAQNK